MPEPGSFLPFVKVFAEHAKGLGYKSDGFGALKYLIGGVGILLLAVFFRDPNSWLVVGLFILLAGLVLYLCLCWLLCYLKKPDLLRSEKYLIEKKKVQNKMLGDSDAGIIEVPDDSQSSVSSISIRSGERQ